MYCVFLLLQSKCSTSSKGVQILRKSFILLCIFLQTYLCKTLDYKTTVSSVHLQMLGMADKASDPGSVSIIMEDSVCNGGPQLQEAPLLTHLKKVENHITEAQRFSHLPKRTAVDLEFRDLSYTIREGPWWKKQGQKIINYPYRLEPINIIQVMVCSYFLNIYFIWADAFNKCDLQIRDLSIFTTSAAKPGNNKEKWLFNNASCHNHKHEMEKERNKEAIQYMYRERQMFQEIKLGLNIDLKLCLSVLYMEYITKANRTFKRLARNKIV